MKVPYETVIEESDHIISKMALSSSIEDRYYYWNFYLQYIEVCGWTTAQLDKELLSRIDRSWDFKNFSLN